MNKILLVAALAFSSSAFAAPKKVAKVFRVDIKDVREHAQMINGGINSAGDVIAVPKEFKKVEIVDPKGDFTHPIFTVGAKGTKVTIKSQNAETTYTAEFIPQADENK